jgi:hypothetical protein
MPSLTAADTDLFVTLALSNSRGFTPSQWFACNAHPPQPAAGEANAGAGVGLDGSFWFIIATVMDVLLLIAIVFVYRSRPAAIAPVESPDDEAPCAEEAAFEEFSVHSQDNPLHDMGVRMESDMDETPLTHFPGNPLDDSDVADSLLDQVLVRSHKNSQSDLDDEFLGN